MIGQLQLQHKKLILNRKSKQVKLARGILHRNRYDVMDGWAIGWVGGRKWARACNDGLKDGQSVSPSVRLN